MVKFKINYFDLGLFMGQELRWMVENIFPKLSIENYKAYGFEACEKYAKNLNQYFENNGKVDIINKAISDRKQNIKLYYANNAVGHSIFDSKQNVNKEKYETVEGIKFSEWIAENVSDFATSFNIIKVNIEGAEWHLFNDLCETGLNKNVHIFCGQGHDVEKVGQLKEKVEEYYKLLEENKIKLYRFTEWKPHENDNIEHIIKKELIEFYKNNESLYLNG